MVLWFFAVLVTHFSTIQLLVLFKLASQACIRLWGAVRTTAWAVCISAHLTQAVLGIVKHDYNVHFERTDNII
jgi:hypothetical protein